MNTLGRAQGNPVFAAQPTPTLLLDSDHVIRAANRAYTSAVGRSADELLGMPIFEAFPDNPDDPEADGVANLTLSLERTARSRRVQRMLVQRYDLRDPATDEWVPRVWSPVNSPIEEGDQVLGLAHQVQDLTPLGTDIQQALHAYRDVLADDGAGRGPGTNPRRRDEHLEILTAALTDQQALLTEVADLRRALTSRATIDIAKGLVMAERRCSPDDAFLVLRELSTTTNVRLADVALALVYQAQRGRDSDPAAPAG